MLKKLFKFISSNNETSSTPQLIIPRDQHTISRKVISHAALKIMKQLNDQGFQAFLVGGGVRDILLGGQPKDFDVATDATPEQIKRLFRSARIIGRRFKIVHVRFGREVIEVTTFRGHNTDSQNEDGMLLRDNVFGTLKSDAIRRDFTINALYYTLKDFAIHDYTGGIKDLEKRTLRIIGDPSTRYKEDPVRMLRAIRFAGKLGFSIEAKSKEPIFDLAELLRNIPAARLFDEVLKLFFGGSATATFALLREYNLFGQLFPAIEVLIARGDTIAEAQAMHCMSNTDKRIRAGKTVTPAFIYAALLWPPLKARQKELSATMPKGQAYLQAAQEMLDQQQQHTTIPKRFSIPMREIWDLQHRLTLRNGQRAYTLLDNPRFRAAYDFVLLREDAGERLSGLGTWWTQFQTANEVEREKMVSSLSNSAGKKKRVRKPKPKSPKTLAP